MFGSAGLVVAGPRNAKFGIAVVELERVRLFPSDIARHVEKSLIALESSDNYGPCNVHRSRKNCCGALVMSKLYGEVAPGTSE